MYMQLGYIQLNLEQNVETLRSTIGYKKEFPERENKSKIDLSLTQALQLRGPSVLQEIMYVQ